MEDRIIIAYSLIGLMVLFALVVLFESRRRRKRRKKDRWL